MKRGPPLLLAAALTAIGACASGGALRDSARFVHAQIETARVSGAMRCAPKDLALAEANTQFADDELDRGNASRAREHLEVARKNVKEALRLSSACAPTQAFTRKLPPERIRIEKIDSDGDGVADVEDACPDEAGPAENHGCPIAKDTDGDGIPDDVDRCPLDPEDKDGFQDDDGCPDPDNDGDGIVDTADDCPNTPGPLENRGCPLESTPRPPAPRPPP